MTKAQKAREYKKNDLEGGEGFNPYEAQRTTMSQIRAEIEAEWNLEETKKRRIGWNDFIDGLKVNGTINPADVKKQEEKQGWRMEQLKYAIERHGL